MIKLYTVRWQFPGSRKIHVRRDIPGSWMSQAEALVRESLDRTPAKIWSVVQERKARC